MTLHDRERKHARERTLAQIALLREALDAAKDTIDSIGDVL